MLMVTLIEYLRIRRFVSMRGRMTTLARGVHALVIVLVIGIIPMAAYAATVEPSFTYQGRLTDANGNPLSGLYTIQFGIYDQSSGGSNGTWSAKSSSVCDKST
jgi:hypothetical protein